MKNQCQRYKMGSPMCGWEIQGEHRPSLTVQWKQSNLKLSDLAPSQRPKNKGIILSTSSDVKIIPILVFTT